MRTIVLVPVGFAAIYLWATKSEPYQFSVDYVQTNPEIEKVLGVVTDVRLRFLDHSASYSQHDGVAEYTMNVSGKKQKGQIHLKLKKLGGVWGVSNGTIVLENGEAIDLF